MKRLFFTLVTLVLCVTTNSFQSCSDAKYTVWTDTASYSTFQSGTQISISDGYYIRAELSESDWEAWTQGVTEGKHRWSEEEIKKWLIGCGFGETKPRKNHRG